MGIDPDLAADFATLVVTVPDEAITAGPTSTPVWAENWPALCLFVACETAWRCVIGARVVWLGLDYPAAEVLERRMQITGVDWHDLQTLEVAALEVLNS